MANKRTSQGLTEAPSTQEGGPSEAEILIWKYLDSTYGGFSIARVRDLPSYTKDMVLAEISVNVEQMSLTEVVKLYVDALASGRLARAETDPDQRTIPPKRRTRPMTIREAAKLMGYARTRGEKKAAETLSKSMAEGVIRCEKINRQLYVFDRSDFPAEVWPKLAPTDPNRP